MEKFPQKKSFYSKQKTKKESTDEYKNSIKQVLLYKNRRNLFSSIYIGIVKELDIVGKHRR